MGRRVSGRSADVGGRGELGELASDLGGVGKSGGWSAGGQPVGGFGDRVGEWLGDLESVGGSGQRVGSLGRVAGWVSAVSYMSGGSAVGGSSEVGEIGGRGGEVGGSGGGSLGGSRRVPRLRGWVGRRSAVSAVGSGWLSRLGGSAFRGLGKPASLGESGGECPCAVLGYFAAGRQASAIARRITPRLGRVSGNRRDRSAGGSAVRSACASLGGLGGRVGSADRAAIRVGESGGLARVGGWLGGSRSKRQGRRLSAESGGSAEIGGRVGELASGWVSGSGSAGWPADPAKSAIGQRLGGNRRKAAKSGETGGSLGGSVSRPAAASNGGGLGGNRRICGGDRQQRRVGGSAAVRSGVPGGSAMHRRRQRIRQVRRIRRFQQESANPLRQQDFRDPLRQQIGGDVGSRFTR
jgi:hypothetical protein